MGPSQQRGCVCKGPAGRPAWPGTFMANKGAWAVRWWHRTGEQAEKGSSLCGSREVGLEAGSEVGVELGAQGTGVVWSCHGQKVWREQGSTLGGWGLEVPWELGRGQIVLEAPGAGPGLQARAKRDSVVTPTCPAPPQVPSHSPVCLGGSVICI